MIDGWFEDTRAAMRSLGRSRGFTATAVLTLGTGLALCLTVLAVVNAYLLRSLPYPEADRLYSIRYAAPDQRLPAGLEELDWSSLDDVVEVAIAWDLDVFYMLGGTYPESVPGAWVTPGFSEGFGVRAAIGRPLTSSDFEPGRPMVALISHELWQSRFGGDHAIVGRRFSAYVSDRPAEPEALEIIGVMPPGFWHFNRYTGVLAPLRSPSYPYQVRVRKGVSAAVVADRITALVRSGSRSLPAEWRAQLVPTQAGYSAVVRPVLLAVAAAAGLVLLIACANVAVLLLVRGSRREREMGLRLALGASRRQVVRLMGIEAAILGGAATATGVALTVVVLARLGPIIEPLLERRVPGGVSSLGIDPLIVIAAVAGGVVATVAFALAPLVVTGRHSLTLAMASGGRTAGDAAGRGPIRSALIGLEVAVSFTLLTGALLMTASAMQMLRVDFGMNADRVVSAGLALREQTFPDPSSRADFYDRLLAHLEGSFAGRAAAFGDSWPLQQPRTRRVESEGAPVASADIGVIGVTPEYFSVLGISVRSGRAFTAQDRQGGEPVVVVSESLARRLWGTTPAVGRRLLIHPGDDNPPTQPVSHVVVGVTGDVRQGHADDNLLDAYVPLMQNAGRFAFLHLPSDDLSPAGERQLREGVAAVHAQVALTTPRSVHAAIDQERSRPRALAAMLAAFAGFALLLSLVGMYGVVSYAVRQREREIAVRMAVGADRRSVVWLFLRHGGIVLVAGLAAGGLGSAGMGRVLQTQLFGVEHADARVLLGTVVALAACGLMAIWWPARRAASIDPAIALKSE